MDWIGEISSLQEKQWKTQLIPVRKRLSSGCKTIYFLERLCYVESWSFIELFDCFKHKAYFCFAPFSAIFSLKIYWIENHNFINVNSSTYATYVSLIFPNMVFFDWWLQLNTLIIVVFTTISILNVTFGS